MQILHILVDQKSQIGYNSSMNINNVLQWSGAVAIIAMHIRNAMGPDAYPWNIISAFIGTVLFLIWTIRVRNAPQLTVNVVALGIGLVGLYRAFV